MIQDFVTAAGWFLAAGFFALWITGKWDER